MPEAEWAKGSEVLESDSFHITDFDCNDIELARFNR
jgi:hypothetical protein